MQLRTLATALGLGLTLAGPAAAQSIVDGSKVDDIVSIARSYGAAELEKRDNGDPRIAGQIDGLTYQVFFMNCTADKGCEDINFYAGFTDTKPTMDALNDWNRNKRFGNAYLDSDLDAVIEYDVNLEYGVTRENLEAAFGLWSRLLGDFATYIGFKAP